MTQEQQLTQERIQFLRGVTEMSESKMEEARKEYGSVKEFRFCLLEENLDCSVYKLAKMFRLSYRQTERVIDDWKRSDRYQEYLRREWNRLYRSDKISDEVKFDKLTVLLKQSMMTATVSTVGEGKQIRICWASDPGPKLVDASKP